MPITPPKLDDRKYDDIVRDARALIPQYCPDWTNLGDADPGMTLVQLFAWMTEMTIYRLNRVPDKTYVHFLNFIGEERRQAQPAEVPLTFYLRQEDKEVCELPPFTRCSTKASEGSDAIHFLTTEAITVHHSAIQRMVAVHAGKHPTVREIPFEASPDCEQALLFADGRGVQTFRMDPVEHGPRSYTPYQYLYVAHDDFRLMDFKPGSGVKVGKMRVRSGGAENLPVAGLFRWEYFTGDLEKPWEEIKQEEEELEVLGLPEFALKAHLPKLKELSHFGNDQDPFSKPKVFVDEPYWVRATVDYDAWLAERMSHDLEITWRDDRGGEERLITNWDVKNTGRYVEFFIQDMPPIRGGWTVGFTMVDRSMAAGRNAYFPQYRWSYRRGERWEELPRDRTRVQGTSIILTGPFTEMATDGFNLRAERIEALTISSFLQNLELELTWMRPVEIGMAWGPETNAAVKLESPDLPTLPFQPAPTLPPLLGMKFFVGSDLFENRALKPVLMEIEVGFELESQFIEEPEGYHLQFTYRAADTWRVVYSEDGKFAEFRFADVDPEGALVAAKRKIRFLLDPRTQLKGLERSLISGKETCWLRLELTKAALTHAPDKKTPPKPIALKVFSVKLGVDGVVGQATYEQPMPGLKVATVEYRDHNRRLSQVTTRSAGKLEELYPFDTFIDIDEGDEGDEVEHEHHAVYMNLTKPLPAGQRHSLMFKCRGETYLPEGFSVQWEMLEDGGHGRLRWTRLETGGETTGGESYLMNRSGVLEFPYSDPVVPPVQGSWIRGIFRSPEGEQFPAFPPLSHLLMNSVEGVNLHAFRMEKFSGTGVPHQTIQLRHFPLYLHQLGGESSVFPNPDRFEDIRVYVVEGDGQTKEWRLAPGNSILTASKDDRVFTVDAVEGSISFGNGIRGKLLPVGNYNLSIEVYHVIPGDPGNVGPKSVALVEGFADLTGVMNLLPANGGRNAESIEEIMRRAPSVLTSRDRAVTRLDFEVIAKEASGEVARAACDGRMTEDGQIEIVVLPQRREGEKVPDPFLSTGLKEHVQNYLSQRCLVNVQPMVRLATFHEVDVSVAVRLKHNANFIVVREAAQSWVEKFLDAYEGGLDGGGWPFAGTLFAQDFGRMVKDIPEVRHVIDVNLYPVRPGLDAEFAGWEKGQGVKTLLLNEHDLFSIRHVRIVSDEDQA